MIQQKYNLDKCFSAIHFELLCLDDHAAGAATPYPVSQGLANQDDLGDYDAFYTILVDEIRKPISNKVLEFAKHVNPEEIQYGLVMCEPISYMNGDQDIAYQTNLIFSGNGELGKNKLNGFNSLKIPPQHIVIRVMTDPTVDNLLLFLWSPEKIDFFNWTLFIPSTAEKIQFNPAGAGKISHLAINDLNDKLIYFRAGKKIWIDYNRFQTINEAVFF
jgi:hypothetical protein